MEIFPDKLTVMIVSAPSICNKSSIFEAALLEHEPDVVIMTETWLSESVENTKFLPPNYTACRKDRGSRGGGVAIVHKTSIHCTEIFTPPELECVACTIQMNGQYFVVIAVYRPPGTPEEYMILLNNFLIDKFSHSN